MPRRIRFTAALVTLFALLFAQIAGAAYACPQWAPAPQAAMMHADMAAMPDCASMDKQSPSLCATSKQGGQHFLGHPGEPQLPPFVPSSVVGERLVPAPVSNGFVRLPLAFLQAVGSGPPISIRHCCFRI